MEFNSKYLTVLTFLTFNCGQWVTVSLCNCCSEILYFIRLGVDDSSCQYCPENLSTTEQMKTHISETKELIGHLKTHSRTSTSQAQAEKKESTALKEGFYHPTLKRPKHSGVSRQPNKSEKMEQLPNKKTNTQYYIFKEKGKIKKVVRTVFKPNEKFQHNLGKRVELEEETGEDGVKGKTCYEFDEFDDMKEESSVDDELSCNLDDLLRSFEEEELGQSSGK